MTLTWKDLAEGSALPAHSFGPITRTDVVRYQGASGDFQPIHHDEPFARAAGYEAPLVVGMYPAGVMSAWAAAQLGAENVRRTRVRFKAPVWPGDVLEITGHVARRYEDGPERKVDVELSCAKPDGVVAVQGTMTFVVPE